MSADASRTDAICPRCGYDLRGAVALWRDRCPLAGTCTECGLEFEWAELLSDAYTVPRWSIESPRGLRRFPLQMAATLIRACRPWRFWSAQRMSHPIRWWRIIAFIGVVAAGLYGCFALLHGWVALEDFIEYTSWGGQRRGTTGSDVFWGAVSLPLGSTPTWGWTTPGRIFGYVWMGLVFALGAGLIMHAGCALTFAALPVTRRQCKVRWAHVARVACHGLVLLVPPVALTLVASPPEARMSVWSYVVGWPAVIAWWMLPFAEVAWWTAATARYLRMPHALGVGIAVAVVGTLLGLAIVLWIALLANPI